MDVYDFTVKNAAGEEVSLTDYRGKTLLIVNTATDCGFTPQYEELEKLYEAYRDRDFVILDFPCNQFGNQAPGTNEEIVRFCTLKYGVSFPVFSKIDVNGENAAPLYRHLTERKGFRGFNSGHKLSALLDDMLAKSNPNYKNEPDIKWNFTKFLVDRTGEVVERFEPTEDIAVIEEKVKELLA